MLKAIIYTIVSRNVKSKKNPACNPKGIFAVNISKETA
jgi:hypothetical protein